MILLGVNIDHVATVRQARGTSYPDIVEAALAAERGGADGITVHLREDRRHIQDRDVERLLPIVRTKLNLEMAVTPEMVDIGCRLRPADVCLVPERRQELTTEGGLDVGGEHRRGRRSGAPPAGRRRRGEPVHRRRAGADRGGEAAGCRGDRDPHRPLRRCRRRAGRAAELERVRAGVALGRSLGLVVNAGHGLTRRQRRPDRRASPACTSSTSATASSPAPSSSASKQRCAR